MLKLYVDYNGTFGRLALVPAAAKVSLGDALMTPWLLVDPSAL